MARPSLRNLLCLVGGSSLMMTGCSSFTAGPTPATSTSTSSQPASKTSQVKKACPSSSTRTQLPMFQSPESDSAEATNKKVQVDDTIIPDPDASTKQNKSGAKTRNPLRLAVLRLGVTEPRMTSPFNYGEYKDGVFTCGYCGSPLFDGTSKYDSGSGWPSFWRSVSDGAITYQRELDGRLECKCGKCDSHLGHVFLDGPTPDAVDTDLLRTSPTSDPRSKSNKYLPRFCINGAAMDYQKRS